MGAPIRVITRRVGGLAAADLDAERAVLSDAERDRAARFVFDRGQIEYTAAHALVRSTLAETVGVRPQDFHFVDGPYGKPAAWLGDRPAPVSFNLSHTRGMVAVAVGPGGLDLGVDVECTARRVELSIADSYFAPPEVAWLMALPEPERLGGFFTLWTLKEAFIKAIGKGMSQELDTFWFAGSAADPSVDPVRIAFAPEIGDDPSAWCFERRVLGGSHAIAVGWRGPGNVDWSGAG